MYLMLRNAEVHNELALCYCVQLLRFSDPTERILLKFACWQESSLTKGGCILSLVRRGYALAQARPRRHIKGADSLVPRLSPARDVDAGLLNS